MIYIRRFCCHAPAMERMAGRMRIGCCGRYPELQKCFVGHQAHEVINQQAVRMADWSSHGVQSGNTDELPSKTTNDARSKITKYFVPGKNTTKTSTERRQRKIKPLASRSACTNISVLYRESHSRSPRQPWYHTPLQDARMHPQAPPR